MSFHVASTLLESLIFSFETPLFDVSNEKKRVKIRFSFEIFLKKSLYLAGKNPILFSREMTFSNEKISNY